MRGRSVYFWIAYSVDWNNLLLIQGVFYNPIVWILNLFGHTFHARWFRNHRNPNHFTIYVGTRNCVACSMFGSTRMNVPARADTFLDREGPYRNQLGCPFRSVMVWSGEHHHVNRPKFYTSNREHDDERRDCSMLFVFSLHVQTQPFLWSYVVIFAFFGGHGNADRAALRHWRCDLAWVWPKKMDTEDVILHGNV